MSSSSETINVKDTDRQYAYVYRECVAAMYGTQQSPRRCN
jgi:hypothetical protein